MVLPSLIDVISNLFSGNTNNCVLHKPERYDSIFHRHMNVNKMVEYYHEDELQEKIKKYILAHSPYSQEIKIEFKNDGGCYIKPDNNPFNMKIKITIVYKNGISATKLFTGIQEVCSVHFSEIPNYQTRHYHDGRCLYSWELDIYRLYTDEVLLSTCRKYADRISQGMPIGMATIRRRARGDNLQS